MRWSRDAIFTDYPTGWIGEPTGQCQAGDIQFRASKRNLHWLTLTDSAGQGLALLPVAGTNLISRANAITNGDTILFASTGVSGPRDFSGSWVADQEVKARQGKSLAGAFTLRAVVP
jgi:hypothetical protein